MPLRAASFDVTDYGAVGDDGTDNTAVFTACLNAIIAAGGGKMYLPDGVYRGRIIIPPQGGPSWITIEIVGESEPTPVFGTIGSFPPRNHGTIIKSLATSGAAVISAGSGSLYSGFSGVYVVIRNLDVRTYDNPQISGIDLNHAVQCRLENVVVSTGVYNVQVSQPTHCTNGLVTPRTPPPLPAAAIEAEAELKRQLLIQERLRELRETKAVTTGGATTTRNRTATQQPGYTASVVPVGLHGVLRKRSEIRRAVILREVLGPPLGLR
jgi:hypothetical protein